jgi:hypothetical protein
MKNASLSDSEIRNLAFLHCFDGIEAHKVIEFARAIEFAVQRRVVEAMNANVIKQDNQMSDLHIWNNPLIPIEQRLELAVIEIDKLRALLYRYRNEVPDEVSQFFNQIIRGDFMADNAEDLHLALVAREKVYSRLTTNAIAEQANAKVSGAGTASAGLPGYAAGGNGERK